MGEAPPQMPSSPADSAEAEAATLSKEGGWPPAQIWGSYTLTFTHTLPPPPPAPVSLAAGKVARAWLQVAGSSSLTHLQAPFQD